MLVCVHFSYCVDASCSHDGCFGVCSCFVAVRVRCCLMLLSDVGIVCISLLRCEGFLLLSSHDGCSDDHDDNGDVDDGDAAVCVHLMPWLS